MFTVGKMTDAQLARLPMLAPPEVTCPIVTITRESIDVPMVKPRGPVRDRIIRNGLSPCLK